MIAAIAVSREMQLLSENAIPWTIERFLELPQDLHRYELVEGALLMSPAPSNPHQRVTKNFVRLFEAVAQDGWDVLQDADVKFTPTTLLRPDVVVAQEAPTTTVEDVIMVVEVESPSSRTYDRIMKHWMYADHGIGWYLRVEMDGAHAPVVFAYRLKSGVYVEHARAHAGQVLTLTEPAEVSFDPAALLKARM